MSTSPTFKVTVKLDGSYEVEPSSGVLPDGTTWSARYLGGSAPPVMTPNGAPGPSVAEVNRSLVGNKLPTTFQYAPHADVCAAVLLAAGFQPGDQMPSNGWAVVLGLVSRLRAERDQLARLMAGEPLMIPCTCPAAHHLPACGRSAKAGEAVPEAFVGPCPVCLGMALADGCTCPGCGAEGKPLPVPPTKRTRSKNKPLRDGKGGLVCEGCGQHPVRTERDRIVAHFARNMIEPTEAIARYIDAFATVNRFADHSDQYLWCSCGRVYAPALTWRLIKSGGWLLTEDHQLTLEMVERGLQHR